MTNNNQQMCEEAINILEEMDGKRSNGIIDAILTDRKTIDAITKVLIANISEIVSFIEALTKYVESLDKQGALLQQRIQDIEAGKQDHNTV